MKNNNETKVSVLNPLLIAMSVCFAVLKLADIISMSWWLVATPIIIMVGIWLLIIIGMLLAAFGKMPPVWAALLHTLSSVIVIFNSARLVRTGEELTLEDGLQEKE